MKKQRAIELLGGSVTATAAACEITASAVSQWPDEGELPRSIENRVLAALARKHRIWPELIDADGAPAPQPASASN